MVSSVEKRLDELSADGRAALIGYLPVGFPDVATSVDAVNTLIDAGVDIIELGVPYSDPVMDGPMIAAAVQSALESGARLTDVFDVVKQVSGRGVPILVMTYYNPVFHYGVERFAADLAAAGGAGLITPDLTPDSAHEWIEAADRHGLDKVFLVAPSSTDQRVEMTAKASRGFVYAASTMGVTGERVTVSDAARELVHRTRERGAQHVCVGLGVSTPEQAAAVGTYADGVIVGSAFVRPLVGTEPLSERLAALRTVASAMANSIAGSRSKDNL
ncbi:tryptophan synthase subunit alpha [Jonesia quinghaiensis]|uniref:tryptophan synthase subunit alpha n=1 Tax=Jonesia quinghaiensis TaxID=262806 RepID=UPI000414D8F5|nr:tryptophan synthase subunit alpha [Jonesia quinghaiensis]